MKYLLLLSLRTIKENKWRSLVNIAVIAFSVAMVVITNGFFASTIEAQRQLIIFDLPADLPALEISKALANDPALREMRTLAAVLNVLMLTIAAFSIYGSFAAGIRERAKLMAVLMTVGAGDLQKSFVTLAEALLLSVIGIPCGVLLGIPVVFVSSNQLETLFYETGFSLSPLFEINIQSLLPICILALATVLLATLISIIKTMRRSVIGLAKSTVGIEICLKKSPMDWFMWHCFGKAGELASANFVNQKRNYHFLSLSFAIAITLYTNGNLILPYVKQGATVVPQYAETIVILENIVNSVISSIVLLAVLNAACMLGTNFEARKGEFAILQSIGMDTKMLHKIVVLEWVYRGAYLFLYGVVGSYLVNFALYTVFNLSGRGTAYLINPLWELLHAFLVMVVLIIVMTVAMLINLRRMNIVETLKTIN